MNRPEEPGKMARPEASFGVWPGFVICSAVQMVLTADELPGIGDAFESMRHAFSPELSGALSVLTLSGAPHILIDLCYEDGGIDLAPGAFLDWIDGLESRALVDRVQATVGGDDSKDELFSAEPKTTDGLAEWHQKPVYAGVRARAIKLLADPPSFHRLVATTMRSFWNDHFRVLYEHGGPAMKEAVERLIVSGEGETLSGTISKLVGRPVPGLVDDLIGVERVLLTPFPFLGPYVLARRVDEGSKMQLFAFDAERALRLRAPADLAIDVMVLKALADETRLRILAYVRANERFGGDIVTHLGITQPGVSRHLRLLTAAGLLRVRQEGTAKYYALDDERLDSIAHGLREMRTAEASEENEVA